MIRIEPTDPAPSPLARKPSSEALAAQQEADRAAARLAALQRRDDALASEESRLTEARNLLAARLAVARNRADQEKRAALVFSGNAISALGVAHLPATAWSNAILAARAATFLAESAAAQASLIEADLKKAEKALTDFLAGDPDKIGAALVADADQVLATEHSRMLRHQQEVFDNNRR